MVNAITLGEQAIRSECGILKERGAGLRGRNEGDTAVFVDNRLGKETEQAQELTRRMRH